MERVRGGSEMQHEEYELLKEYKKWITEYEESSKNIEKLIKKKKNYKSKLEKFDKEHLDDFREADKYVPSTKRKVGLGALTVLTGGLATGLLVKEIGRDKNAEEWNSGWRARYEEAYFCERRELMFEDEEKLCQLDKDIEHETFIKEHAEANICAEHNGFVLIEQLRNIDAINQIISIFDSGEAESFEDALKVYYSIDYSCLENLSSSQTDKKKRISIFRKKQQNSKTWKNV